jgi:hypothetical protein
LRELLAAAAAREKVVIIHEQGKAVAALISPADLARLRRYDAQREADFAVIERMREAFKDVPDDELEREVAKALAEVRAEMRAEREQAARTA